MDRASYHSPLFDSATRVTPYVQRKRPAALAGRPGTKGTGSGLGSLVQPHHHTASERTRLQPPTASALL